MTDVQELRELLEKVEGPCSQADYNALDAAAVDALPSLLAVYDAAAVHLSLITYDQDPRTWSATWLGAVEDLAAAVAAVKEGT